jgi:hypothetical protein
MSETRSRTATRCGRGRQHRATGAFGDRRVVSRKIGLRSDFFGVAAGVFRTNNPRHSMPVARLRLARSWAQARNSNWKPGRVDFGVRVKSKSRRVMATAAVAGICLARRLTGDRTAPGDLIFLLSKADRPSAAAFRDGRICRVGPGSLHRSSPPAAPCLFPNSGRLRREVRN